MSRNSQKTGYTDCACRDCFEIAIGVPGVALCHECEASGCDPEGHHECAAPDAYEGRSCPRNEHDGGFDYLTVQWLASELRTIQHSAPWDAIEPDPDGDVVCVYVRLQVAHGDAFVHSGDPSFDTDHRGYWGASVISRDDNISRLVEIAMDLIDQACAAQIEARSAIPGGV